MKVRPATTLAAVLSVVGLMLGATPVAARAAEPIVNTAPPTITGDAVFAARLQVDPGSWTPDGLTFTITWQRDGTTIPGETRRRLRLTRADIGHRITATVTASDSEGAQLAVTSAATDRVRRASFVLRRAPAITGTLRYTHRLHVTRGTWSPAPAAVRLQWLRDGQPIRGATHPSYLLSHTDVGARISVTATARRAGYQRKTVTSSRTAAIGHRVPVRRSVTYRVETRGHITADLKVFRTQVAETYADPRGWRAAGVAFRRVAKGGSFTVVLAQASRVPGFSSACSAQWSCRVGRYVIINQTRWLHASPAWNAAHRSLRDYRHMVVNHETGHWLGHGHAGCPGPGKLAPVMMQQSKGRDGCRFNPWPLRSELWSR